MNMAPKALALLIVGMMSLVACGGSAANPGASPSGPVATGDPIKIGVLQDKSGPVAFSSANQVNALGVAADAMNRGEFFWGAPQFKNSKPGILGRPIQFLFEDTQAKPNLALVATQKLASEGVSAIIGTTSSPDAIQAKVACAQAKIPCLFPVLASSAIVAPPDNQYSYTMTPSFDTQAAQMAQALRRRRRGTSRSFRTTAGRPPRSRTPLRRPFRPPRFQSLTRKSSLPARKM